MRLGEAGFFGLPFQVENEVLIYNPRRLRQKGIEPPTFDQPWNFADLRRAAIKLTEPEQGKYGLGLVLNSPAPIHEYWGLKRGITDIATARPDGRHAIHVSDRTGDLLTWLRNLVCEDKVTPAEVFADGSDIALVQGYVAGKYAMIAGVGSRIREQFINQCACMNIPVPYAVAPPCREESAAGAVHVRAVFVAAKGKHQKDTWQFLSFFLNRDNQQRLALRSFALPARRSARAAPEFHAKVDFWEIVARGARDATVPDFMLAPGWDEFCIGVGKEIYQAFFRREITLAELIARVEKE